MRRSQLWPGPGSWRQQLGVCALAVVLILSAQRARADETVVSFWVPGQFGSLAAAPTTPGWSLGVVYYHISDTASGAVAAAREIEIGRCAPTVNVSLNANLNAQGDLAFLSPTYTFATPVLGGQFSAGVSGVFGRIDTSIAGTLTAAVGPITVQRTGTISDSLTSVGDLYPMLTLKWHDGVNNWMTYLTGHIPVGAYDPNRLSNIGIGHGAIDAGGGYTYLNPVTGHEFSAVAGFTYNFKNPDAQYQSGIDCHFDWGASQFLSRHFLWGSSATLISRLLQIPVNSRFWGPFESRVIGIGPQVGYIFPIGKMQDI
jgi:hypothetical protein